jgi:hypothetical protein
MQDPKDGLTEAFYELMAKLESVKGFVTTLERFGILTEDEMRVMYHHSHVLCIEQLRQT